ncbi:hypothetical protein EYF80_031169 [Liparis tanakae]|uniref:Uncharacterized protein n=1 Tax=Liparis tanakae TaxID=230148 RepID=A0A4Z2GYL7_9TELE|nr:hypothetical protein EYF80_031169 [Liparis tanakae]
MHPHVRENWLLRSRWNRLLKPERNHRQLRSARTSSASSTCVLLFSARALGRMQEFSRSRDSDSVSASSWNCIGHKGRVSGPVGPVAVRLHLALRSGSPRSTTWVKVSGKTKKTHCTERQPTSFSSSRGPQPIFGFRSNTSALVYSSR